MKARYAIKVALNGDEDLVAMDDTNHETVEKAARFLAKGTHFENYNFKYNPDHPYDALFFSKSPMEQVKLVISPLTELD